MPDALFELDPFLRLWLLGHEGQRRCGPESEAAAGGGVRGFLCLVETVHLSEQIGHLYIFGD